MKINSLAHDGVQWHPCTIELTLLPGLPTLQILGPVSRRLKEAGPRLKSALVHQGFTWPRTKQLIINIRSPAAADTEVELAIAAAILFETGQVKWPKDRSDWLFFGYLGLDGSVLFPEIGWHLDEASFAATMVSGADGFGWVVKNLEGLKAPVFAERKCVELRRPEFPSWRFCEAAADLLAVVATGEHSVLLAGPAGTGKTTIADSLHLLMPEPRVKKASNYTFQDADRQWRPKVAPHHTTSPLAILGGGTPPRPGEISRADGGMLFLDEYLEFPPRVQESLREPVERGQIRLARSSRVRTFPAQFQLVAATNLCPCGKLTPERTYSCQVSVGRCKTNVQRLSGPMLDRFEIVAYSNRWKGPKEASLADILLKTEKATEFRLKRGQTLPNSLVPLHEIEKTLTATSRLCIPGADSERRRQAVVRIARTVADLQGITQVLPEHISQGEIAAIHSHLEMGRIFA